jgi:hypothetical protein
MQPYPISPPSSPPHTSQHCSIRDASPCAVLGSCVGGPQSAGWRTVGPWPLAAQIEDALLLLPLSFFPRMWHAGYASCADRAPARRSSPAMRHREAQPSALASNRAPATVFEPGAELLTGTPHISPPAASRAPSPRDSVAQGMPRSN